MILKQGSSCGRGRERKKCKYELTASYCYELPECFIDLDGSTVNRNPPYVTVKSNKLTIRNGYRWNGANFFPELDWTRRASLVHDALCQILDEGSWNVSKNSTILRRCADREWYCIVVADGSGHKWASITYSAIRGNQKLKFLGGLLGGIIGIFRGKSKYNFNCGKETDCGEALTLGETSLDQTP